MRRLSLLALLALSACVEAPVEATPEFGATAFQEDCSACHGSDAKGGGPLAEGLPAEPPDLTTLARRNGGVFPRDYVLTTIDGYVRGDHSSGAMPEFGAGDMGPLVIVEEDGLGTPIPARLLALALWLERVQE